MDKTPTRDRILFATAELFRRQGYAGTGLKAVVAEAEAPFGSLYHHFPGGTSSSWRARSSAPAGRSSRRSSSRSTTSKRPPRSPSAPCFAGAAETLEATDYVDACPIATVALEVASTDELLRQATAEVFTSWTEALTERLDGDRDRALAIICALEGAFVLSRALRSTEPMYAAGRLAVAGL